MQTRKSFFRILAIALCAALISGALDGSLLLPSAISSAISESEDDVQVTTIAVDSDETSSASLYLSDSSDDTAGETEDEEETEETADDEETEETEETSATDSTEVVFSTEKLESDASDSISGAIDTQEEASGSVRYTAITTNNTIEDSLSSSGTQNIYVFSTDERGYLLYGFGQSSSNAVYTVTLWQEYNSTGVNGETLYRELYTLTTSMLDTSAYSMEIGVYPGTYRITVDCDSNYSTDDYFNIVVYFTAADNYEAECNDSLERYNELSFGYTMTGCGAKLADGYDTDCYMFEVTEAGYINLTFEHDDLDYSQVGFNIYIYDMYGNEYFFSRSYLSDTEITSGNIGLQPGYYFVQIDARIFCESNYYLTVDFTSAENYETEGNDSKATATPVTDSNWVTGNITNRTSADRDWYVYTATESGSIVMFFSHETTSSSTSCWNITVMDSSGTTLYSDTSSLSDSLISTPYIGVSAGLYYIRIDPLGLVQNEMDYSIVVYSTSSGTWETEDNNTPETADEIDTNTDVNGTLIESGLDFDTDYYVFTLDDDSEIMLTFSHTVLLEEGEAWVITLLDEDLNEVATLTSDRLDESVSTETLYLSPGTYYICVETGLYFSRMMYTLNVYKELQQDFDIIV